MSAVPRLNPGNVVEWQRPAGPQPWPTEGIGRVLDDGTLLLRSEAVRLVAWFKKGRT